MIFDLKFFLLLIFSSVVYWIIPKQQYRNIFLSIVSLAFIYFLDKYALLVVLFLTSYTYFFGNLIETKRNKGIFHKIGITGLILILVLFKYLGLLSNTFNGIFEFFDILPVLKIEKLLLPLGLSYIIFKYISYLTDIYWGIVKKGNFTDFLLYGSMFTIFTAGPIERFEKFKPQAESTNLKYKSEYFENAFERIIYGLFKKLVIADWIGYFLAPILNNYKEYNLEIQIVALLGFSIQIYMDFSGYSDIAIGSSGLFGIKIMENFNYPYIKPNISQFWRSWHISLSDWIKDYLFFPLSSLSKNKIWLLLFVPVIAMGICGIWHGANWSFLLWGVYHGIGLSVYQIWVMIKKKNKLNSIKGRTSHFFGIIVTFLFVTFGWLFFNF